MKSYHLQIAWERFDLRKALLAVILVLSICFAALLVTARPAIAERQAKTSYKYYTGITVRQGDTLWSIAETRLTDSETASAYKGRRAYMKEVIELNGLKDGNYLMAGQKLIVPYYSSVYKN